MTDLEYIILDEIYFLTSFKKLLNEVNVEEVKMLSCLKLLIEKEWVAIYNLEKDIEIKYEPSIFDLNFHTYSYLATKKGLFAHNSN